MGNDRTVRFVVTVDYPATSIRQIRDETQPQPAEPLEAADEQMEVVLTQSIRPVLEHHGGEVVRISPLLHAVTIQGKPPLVRKLSNVDAVTAILGNQPVHAIHR